jgi:hypothetical protein
MLILLSLSFSVTPVTAAEVEDDEELPFDLIFQEQPSGQGDLSRALSDEPKNKAEAKGDDLDNEVDLDAILEDDIDDEPKAKVAKPEKTKLKKIKKVVEEAAEEAQTEEEKSIAKKSKAKKAAPKTAKKKKSEAKEPDVEQEQVMVTNIDDPIMRKDMPEQAGSIDAVQGQEQEQEQELSKLETQAPTISHQTLNFFASLVGCRNGDFVEKNIMRHLLGPEYLTHNIVGDEEGFCQVVLQTPDNRHLQCLFSRDALREITSGYFIDGIKGYAAGKSDIMSINVEMTWSRLKLDNCGFTF